MPFTQRRSQREKPKPGRECLLCANSEASCRAAYCRLERRAALCAAYFLVADAWSRMANIWRKQESLMAERRERLIDELYLDDPERADAVFFGRRTDGSRRGFLGGAGLTAMGAVLGGPVVFGAHMPGGLMPAALAQDAQKGAAGGQAPKDVQTLNFPGKDPGLVVLGDRPLVAETPEHLLDDDTTPIGKFYIRNNGQIPDAANEPDKWSITVDGEVNNKLELTVGELKSRFRAMTYRMVLECGGNGRAFFQPQARGNQWTNGGAGCAEWTGVPLTEVLKAAGLKDTAKYTAHYGADPHLSGDPTKESLSRGMPIAKAMEE